MPVEAMQTPNVPPITTRIAGMFRKATGLVPSIIAPPSKPRIATPIPMAVAAFMSVLFGSSAGNCRSSPCDGVVGRVTAAVRAGENAGAPVANGRHDGLDPFDHQDLGPGGQRDRRVGTGLDGDDQVGVEVERRGARAETMQLDHDVSSLSLS